jgi:hypothetical protein
MVKEVVLFFMYLLVLLFGKSVCSVNLSFINWTVRSLMFNVLSSFHILDINLLGDHIFSHSVGCLFTLVDMSMLCKSF